jgi:hypothetical protein
MTDEDMAAAAQLVAEVLACNRSPSALGDRSWRFLYNHGVDRRIHLDSHWFMRDYRVVAGALLSYIEQGGVKPRVRVQVRGEWCPLSRARRLIARSRKRYGSASTEE